MATLLVDPASLQALTATLTGIHSEMENMDRVVEGYGGRLGGPDLEDEVEHFCSHWGYGIDQLAEHMAKVVDWLQAAAAEYEKSESEIQAAARSSG